jgi:hypothetical protein
MMAQHYLSISSPEIIHFISHLTANLTWTIASFNGGGQKLRLAGLQDQLTCMQKSEALDGFDESS